MKKYLLAMLFVGLGIWLPQTLTAQNVPASAKAHFEKNYSGAHVKEWEAIHDGGFEVEYHYQGKKYETYYDKNGNWVRTERELKKSEVPQSVWNALKNSSFASYKIDDDDVELHQTPKHAEIYEVEVKNKNEKRKLYVLTDGTVMDRY